MQRHLIAPAVVAAVTLGVLIVAFSSRARGAGNNASEEPKIRELIAAIDRIIGCLVCLMALCATIAFAQDDTGELQRRTQAIRSYVVRNAPAFTEEVKLARRADILWVIEHHPEAVILGDPSATIYPSGPLLPDPTGFELARALWRKVVAPERVAAKVLGNGAAFFISTDQPYAIEMLARARKLEPADPIWTTRLGQACAFAITGISGQNRNGFPTGSNFDPAAAKAQVDKLLATGDAALMGETAWMIRMQGSIALSISGHPDAVLALTEPLLLMAQQLEPRAHQWHYALGAVYSDEAKSQWRPEGERSLFLEKEFAEFSRGRELAPIPHSGAPFDQMVDQIAAAGYMNAALETGHLDIAANAAQSCLNQAAAHTAGTDWGGDLHHCNIVLGRVELRRGNLDQAGTYLIAAGQPPGGASISSFGPNMSLAKELLEKGRPEPVLRYFALCELLWHHPETLQKWKEQVKAGKIPQFGANLFY